MATQAVGSKVTTSAGTTTYGAVNANGTQYQSFTPAAASGSSSNSSPAAAKSDPATSGGSNSISAPTGAEHDALVQQSIASAGGTTTPTTPTTPISPAPTVSPTSRANYATAYTPDEQSQIDTAGAQAGAGVDQSITELQAKEAADVGKLQTAAAGYGGEFSSMAEGQAMNSRSAYEVQISNLRASKVSTINAAKIAIQNAIKTGRQSDYDSALAQYNKAIDQDQSQQKLTTDKATAETNMAKTQADTAAQTFQNVVSDVAPDIDARLAKGEDISTILADYTAKGYDPTVINAALVTYQQAKQKQDLLNGAQTATILSKTSLGKTVNIPGIGDVTILGVNNTGAPTTLDAGNAGLQEYIPDPTTGQMGWHAIIDPATKQPLPSAAAFKLLVSAVLNPNADLSQLKNIFSGVNGNPLNGVSGSFSEPPAGGFRTDRSNNPIAAAVATGGTNEYTKALDAADIKWSYGDKFADDPNMQTIKIDNSKDAVEASRAILSNSTSIQNWYINHSGKSILSQLGINNNEDFKKADKKTQDTVITEIYKNEGGSGSLVGQSPTLNTPQTIAQAIMEGKQAPILTGLYGQSANVRAALQKNGYDLAGAQMDWQATQKLLTTMNSSQQTRLRQAVNFSYDSLDIIDQLNETWKGGNFPLLNSGALLAASTGVDNKPLDKPLNITIPNPDGSSTTTTIKDKQGLATLLNAQINDLTSELGTVYKGGNTSTDESLSLAAGNLKSNWSEDTLNSAIQLARTNLQLRKNSIETTQPWTPNGQSNIYSNDSSEFTPDQISTAKKSLQDGEILVMDNTSGQMGAISQDDFDPNSYTIIQ